MIKHKYQIVGPLGAVFFETTNLAEFQREADRLKDRGTGRSTRMLFSALGAENKHVYIIAKNTAMRTHLMYQLCVMLSNLKYNMTVHHDNHIIKNFGKTYHFITEEYSKSINFRPERDNVIFRDEL